MSIVFNSIIHVNIHHDTDEHSKTATMNGPQHHSNTEEKNLSFSSN